MGVVHVRAELCEHALNAILAGLPCYPHAGFERPSSSRAEAESGVGVGLSLSDAQLNKVKFTYITRFKQSLKNIGSSAVELSIV